MDNLDRTNVAQSAIAKYMLNRQLRDIGIIQEHENVDEYEDFMHHFRNGSFFLSTHRFLRSLIGTFQSGQITQIIFRRRTVAPVLSRPTLRELVNARSGACLMMA